ncbi:translocator outer membrane protein PopD precursor [Pseudomonas aeruginosa VRFPA02]|nr:translocator outer membrane protein PopD precursor [Pseudomonas aeruginosa VRFPA02]
MIDTQYSLAATQAAIPSEPIAPGAAGRSVGTPQAAAAGAGRAGRPGRTERSAPGARPGAHGSGRQRAGQQRRASADSLPHRAESARAGRAPARQREPVDHPRAEGAGGRDAQRRHADDRHGGDRWRRRIGLGGGRQPRRVEERQGHQSGEDPAEEHRWAQRTDRREDAGAWQDLRRGSQDRRQGLGGGPGAGQCGFACGGPCLREPQRRPAGGQHGDPVLRPDGQRLGPGAPGRIAGERPGRRGQRHHRAEPEAEGRGPDELRCRLHEGRPAAHPAVHPEP